MNGMEAGHSDIDVSIVIVNYRVKYFLEQTVRSAKEALAGFSGEIIVVDNNSGDDSIEHLKKCFPDVIAVSYTHLTLPTRCHRCRSRWSPYH